MNLTQVVKDIFKDVKKRKEIILLETATFKDKEGSQTAYTFLVAVHDSLRKVNVQFKVKILVGQTKILAQKIYDEQGKEVDITPRLVDVYLLRRADRPMGHKYSNPLLSDSRW